MRYELWDMLSRNMLADFGTESDALVEIHELLAMNPPEALEDLVLVRREESRGGTLAEGAELVDWARAEDSGRDPISR